MDPETSGPKQRASDTDNDGLQVCLCRNRCRMNTLSFLFGDNRLQSRLCGAPMQSDARNLNFRRPEFVERFLIPSHDKEDSEKSDPQSEGFVLEVLRLYCCQCE